jgi:N-hydroxyarylamine O-acetyltransferase
MNTEAYLQRIGCSSAVEISNESLFHLHEQHVFHIPFENLDVHFGKVFSLKLTEIYDKVVFNKRGGFCYELNSLFNELLCQIGFKSRIIEARIFDDEGNLGPAFDHMAIFVETDRHFLLDVGYGDLFLQPIEIKAGVQTDGRNFFQIEVLGADHYKLLMSSDGQVFQAKYTFILRTVEVANFVPLCLDKQTNPTSHFVRNLVCTKPTRDGRLTIFNDKFIQKIADKKHETAIPNQEELVSILLDFFNIKL